MPIIKRKEKTERTQVNLKIEETLMETLKAYAGYTNVPLNEIVETAVRHAINSDTEFLQFAGNKSSRGATKNLPKAAAKTQAALHAPAQ